MSFFSNINPLNALRSNSGRNDESRKTYWTTPWAWRDDNGCYVGHSDEVWLYRTLEVSPLLWEDPRQRLSIESPLATLLYELGTTSKDLGVGMRSLSRSREIHLLSITWEAQAVPPEGTPAALQDYMENVLQFVVPSKALLVGVRLRPSVTATAGGLMDKLTQKAGNQLGTRGPDMDRYEDDRKLVTEILTRNGAPSAPDRATQAQLESWYNLGRGPDATVLATPDMLFVDNNERIEMAAVMRFDNPEMEAPYGQWAMAAGMHPAGASVISVRGELEASSISRNRVRRSQRKVIAQMEEEAATGDLERPEQAMTYDLAQKVERFILTGREPLITNCSIVMARRVDNSANETYIDELKNAYGLEMKPLQHRQMATLEETLPTGHTRVNPFLQDVSVSMIGYAGMQSFSNLGDPTGCYIGLVDPDYVPCYLDPLGAPAANKPPAMLIAGDPGSGKTFLGQTICLQAALAGLQTIFINPKSDDSLEGLAELVGGTTIKLSQIEKEGGYFDPFRFCTPDQSGRQIAADILGQHILAVLGSRGVAGSGFTQEQEIAVISGLREGADAGAECARQAIDHIQDESVKVLIIQQASDPLFRLAISMTPQPNTADDRKLLLIEFDKPLDIPEKGTEPAQYTRTNRLAVAAVRLVTRASMEKLATSGGGVMFLDEAWMFLQSSEGLAALQSFGRLGRSKNILPIFATQRVDDLVSDDVGMEGYLSRVFVMKLSEEKEARAGLKLLGLDATPERISWLSNAGPRRGEKGQPARGAMALHRDLKSRHSALLVGPVPEDVRMALSTNPEDRARRRAVAAAKAAADRSES